MIVKTDESFAALNNNTTAVCIILVNMQIIAEIRAHPTFISAGEGMCLSSSSSSAARRRVADKAKIIL